MIIGIIIRNFKTYKNINYIPLSNGEKFSGLIGANGIGKSSILEALDCFFNNRQWNENINHGASGEDSSYIVPIFLLKKTEFNNSDSIKDKYEEYSNVMWELISSSLTPSFINSNYKEYIESLKRTLSEIKANKSSHFLIPVGLNRFNHTTISIFRGDFVKPLFSKTIDDNPEKQYEYISTNYITPIYDSLKSQYDYIYIPKDIEAERLIQFETQEIQTLLGEKLENIVSNLFTREQIQNLSQKLKEFINNLSKSLQQYKFRTISNRQPNLKPAIIYGLIVKEFFSLRELHKEGVERDKDLPLRSLSSGEKQQAILSLIHSIITNYRDNSSSLILAVDEPEASLHISACYDQFEKLYRISRKCTQIIFTSHWYGFIPAMISGVIIHIDKTSETEKHNTSVFDISKYREEIKRKTREHGRNRRASLPLDIMLKSSNDFIQSILSSIITESPYNWLICEGSSEIIYMRYYFSDEIKNKKLRIVPVGGATEVKKIYNHLAISFDELKEKIKGKVVLLTDTDEQLVEFDTKEIENLYCYRIINIDSEKQTKLVKIKENPKSPKTELEDTLNGKIFYETLKLFKPKYPDNLSFVNSDAEKEEIPSYYALDLSISQRENLNQFFDLDPQNKILFAEQYIDKCLPEHIVPQWITEIKKKYE